MFCLYDCRPGDIRGFFFAQYNQSIDISIYYAGFQIFIIKSNVIFLTIEIINQDANL